MRDNPLSIVAGVDIGGSHITAALVNLGEKEIMSETYTRLKVDPHGTAEETIAAWSKAIVETHMGRSIGKIGVAMPGPFDYEKGFSFMKDQNKYDALYGMNVKALLAEALSIPTDNISFKNDAACFLQGEVFAGVLKGFHHCIGITLGTGFGSALYKDGGAESIDLWQLPFKSTIAEDYLSTRWFKQSYFSKKAKRINGVKELVDIIERDQTVQQLFDEFGDNLAAFLVNCIEKENPQAVVIGGNIANAYAHFGKAILQLKKTFPHLCVEKSVLGEQAALFGAASLCCMEKPA